MPESPLQQLLDHPNRKWIVGGASVLLALVVGVPICDSIVASIGELDTRTQELLDATRSVANCNVAKERLEALKGILAEYPDGIDEEAAAELRESAVRLTRDSGCRLVKINLADAYQFAWKRGTNPIEPAEVGTDEADVRKLEQRKLTLIAEGNLQEVDHLVGMLRNLHRLALPTQMTVRKGNASGEALELEFEMTLLQLMPQ
ncbi:MAG TPA: hypothetical protein DDW52_28450 [Planctomycetaceae bacterium]|nr:hypothetical protein [Planctomycetaceae bacterium]